MGCFNSVCNLSNLPIYHGDKIKLVLNLPATYASSQSTLVNITDFRIPCFLPISGEYDDYGCIENVKEDENSVAMDSWFKEALVNNRLIKTDRYTKQYEQEDYKGIRSWMKHIGCEGIKVSRHPSETLKKKDGGVYLSYSMILQEVWDKYLTAFDHGASIRKKAAIQCDKWFEWYKTVAAELKAKRKNDFLEFGAHRWGRDLRFSLSAFETPTKIKPFADVSLLYFMSEGSNREFDSSWFTSLYFDNYLHPLFMNGAFNDDSNRSRWTWFRDQYADFVTICRLMDSMPAFWLPFQYARQERGLELHAKLATAKQKIAQKRLDKWKKENGE